MQSHNNIEQVNDVIAFLFIKNMMRPINKTKASRLGLVDDKGKVQPNEPGFSGYSSQRANVATGGASGYSPHLRQKT